MNSGDTEKMESPGLGDGGMRVTRSRRGQRVKSRKSGWSNGDAPALTNTRYSGDDSELSSEDMSLMVLSGSCVELSRRSCLY